MAKSRKTKKQENQNKLESVGALWKQTSKSGDFNYMTGVLENGDRIVAFFNKKKKNQKEPDLRIYYQNELDDEDDEDDELPF